MTHAHPRDHAESVAATMTAPRPAEPVRLSDEAVVERIRAGESALFEVLMRRYNQRLYRVARAILGSDAEAEDVMQEAYVRAYAHLDQFAGRARFATWLTKIAVYEALARARRAGRLVAIGDGDQPGLGAPGALENAAQENAALPSADRDPEREMFDQEVKTMLETSIDALPPDYRSVFTLREIEGLDTAETAECLGIGEPLVKTRLHRARAMIRRDLFARAGATSAAAFQFGASRCDRVVENVMRRIAGAGKPPAAPVPATSRGEIR